MTLEPGRPINDPPDRRPWIAGLVDALGRIHAVAPPPIAGLRDQYARLDLHVQEATPSGTGWWSTRRCGRTSPRHWPRVARRPATLLHDDFHPGNVLWSAVG